MRFILRKYVDASNAADALALDSKTPVHDVYLKEGEEPKRPEAPKDLIGFWHPEEPSFGFVDEPNGRKKV
jgi:hypothetical protein